MPSPLEKQNRPHLQAGQIVILTQEYANYKPDTLAYLYQITIDNQTDQTYCGLILEDGTDIGFIEITFVDRLFIPIARVNKPLLVQQPADLITAFASGLLRAHFNQARQLIKSTY